MGGKPEAFSVRGSIFPDDCGVNPKNPKILKSKIGGHYTYLRTVPNFCVSLQGVHSKGSTPDSGSAGLGDREPAGGARRAELGRLAGLRWLGPPMAGHRL